MKGLTLDAGALIGLERNDRAVLLLLERAQREQRPLAVPASVVAQVARSPRQVGLMRLLQRPTTDVNDLDRSTATAIGRLLGATSTSDVVDAHVAVTATQRGDAIVTSDPIDLRLLAPNAVIIEV